MLGGHDCGWVALIDRVAELSGVHHPVAVLPPTLGPVARRAEALHLPTPIASEGIALMGLNWSYSSRKARPSWATAPGRWTPRCATRSTGTASWIAAGALRGGLSPLSVGAAGRAAGRAAGLTGLARAAAPAAGRSLVAGG